MQLEVSTAGGLEESRLRNVVTGEDAATADSRAFLIRTSKGELTPADFKVDTAARLIPDGPFVHRPVA